MRWSVSHHNIIRRYPSVTFLQVQILNVLVICWAPVGLTAKLFDVYEVLVGGHSHENIFNKLNVDHPSCLWAKEQQTGLSVKQSLQETLL